MHWRPVFRVATLTTAFAVSAAGQGEPQPEPAPTAPVGPSQPVEPAEPAPTDNPEGGLDASPPEASDEAPVPSDPAAPEEAPSAGEAPPPLPPKPRGGEEYAEPELPITPPAADSLGGHFVLTPAAAYSIPFGRLGSNWDTHEQIGNGWSVAVEAGLGVSRQVVIGVFGEFDRWAEGDTCAQCDATGFAVGPFVRYHLVQGLRFDPWIGFGVGYENLKLDDGSTQTSLAGLKWARLAVGGDWYPSRNFGVGPYLGLSSGGYFDRPEQAGALRTHWAFHLGLRLTLDIPGKLK